MRKLLSSLVLALLCSAIAAQSLDHSLEGKIMDENRQPIPFASIVIKAKKAGGTTPDANGNFRISAAKDTVLLAYIASFFPNEITASSDSARNLTLSPPGVYIRLGQGAAGAATHLQIRGVSPLSRGESLIVVVGVPESNRHINTTSPGSSGRVDGLARENLHPNDIEIDYKNNHVNF